MLPKRHKHMDEILEDLKPGELIEVHWLDASRTRRVKMINNAIVAAYKKFPVFFRALEPDTLFGIMHMLADDPTERIDGFPTIYSIPVPIIMNVIPLKRMQVKQISDVGLPMLSGKYAKQMPVADGIGIEETEEEVKEND